MTPPPTPQAAHTILRVQAFTLSRGLAPSSDDRGLRACNSQVARGLPAAGAVAPRHPDRLNGGGGSNPRWTVRPATVSRRRRPARRPCKRGTCARHGYASAGFVSEVRLRDDVWVRAMTMRFPPELWAQLEREASREGVSVAQFVRDAVVFRSAYKASARGEAAEDDRPRGAGGRGGR
jgi:hypothetical protein